MSAATVAAPEAMTVVRPFSPITAAARAFVAAHLAEATALGNRLGELVDDPETFAEELRAGYASLADAAYQKGQEFIAPGMTDGIGVRMPLLRAVRQGITRGARHANSASLLWLSERLLRGTPPLEERLLAFELLERTIASDPERTWQILREAASRAHEWITVDSLAHPYAKGIIAEPVRWAEIEQLAYALSPWQRRLAASTIATLPFANRTAGRGPDVARHALPIIENLIGDANPDVQKALSWALRSMAVVDRDAVETFLERETETAAGAGDGHRAWVIRDALQAITPAEADRLRTRLAGIRRHAGTPSTSRAGAIADAFYGAKPDLRRSRIDQGDRQQQARNQGVRA